MTFTWPIMLFFLLLVPLPVALYLKIQRRRRHLAELYGISSTLQAAHAGPGVRRHIPPALFMLGLAILVFALARPQAEVSLPRLEGTVILAFDVSGSMAAEDFAPTRMEAAKTAARDFVENMGPDVQIGIVAFSDGGFTVQAPTNDQQEIFATIERLEPQRGTSLAHGILTSIDTIAVNFGQAPVSQAAIPETGLDAAPTPTPVPDGMYDSATIVLLSDGENNMNPDPLEAALTASQMGLRIYTIGVGSSAGANLDIGGFLIHTQLDEVMLQQIADITGGEYFNAQNEEELHKIYQTLAPQLVVKPEEIEITSLFVGASLLFLLTGAVFSLFWFSRLP